MKRSLIFLFFFLAGCSTAPVADLMDYFSPGRMASETTPPYGGVAAPQPGSPPLPLGTVAGPSLPPAPPFLRRLPRLRQPERLWQRRLRPLHRILLARSDSKVSI